MISINTNFIERVYYSRLNFYANAHRSIHANLQVLECTWHDKDSVEIIRAAVIDQIQYIRLVFASVLKEQIKMNTWKHQDLNCIHSGFKAIFCLCPVCEGKRLQMYYPQESFNSIRDLNALLIDFDRAFTPLLTQIRIDSQYAQMRPFDSYTETEEYDDVLTHTKRLSDGCGSLLKKLGEEGLHPIPFASSHI